jgi:hypothetical protein
MSRFTINNIIASNYPESQPWHTRKKGGDKNVVKNKVIEILKLISGNDNTIFTLFFIKIFLKDHDYFYITIIYKYLRLRYYSDA